MTDMLNLERRILPLRMLLLDVDGVLTDGSIIYTDKGDEIKTFSVKDGLGIRLLMDAGVDVGIITGRRSNALLNRCDNLGIKLIFDGVKNKEAVLDSLVMNEGFSYNEIAYVGDDLPDIQIMKKSGLPIAVADACSLVLSHAAYITSAKGGKGAVREISELILKTKGLWDQIIQNYL